MTPKQEKLILALIGSEPDGLKPIEVHKLLFMIGQFSPKERIYEHIPFKMGCYSVTLSKDLRKLESKGLLRSTTDSRNKPLLQLTAEGTATYRSIGISRRFVDQFRQLYPLRGKDLVIDVYKRYPYWAINSTIGHLLLGNDIETLDKISKARPTTRVRLASIGYEGRSIENYFNALVKAGIGVLCDVRKNPISRKYGFSRSTLSWICEGCGIEYRHYPQLGIPSWERKDLNCQEDYDILFEWYERTILPNAQQTIGEIADLVKQSRGVALTCFEANPAQCHRTRVARIIAQQSAIQPVQI